MLLFICRIAFGSDEVVRVVSVGKDEYLDVEILSQKNFNGPLCRFHTCLVSIIVNDDLSRKPRQKSCLVLCECSSKARYGIGDPVLGKGNEVQIALDEYPESDSADFGFALEQSI